MPDFRMYELQAEPTITRSHCAVLTACPDRIDPGFGGDEIYLNCRFIRIISTSPRPTTVGACMVPNGCKQSGSGCRSTIRLRQVDQKRPLVPDTVKLQYLGLDDVGGHRGVSEETNVLMTKSEVDAEQDP